MSDKAMYIITKFLLKLSVFLFILSIMIFLTYLLGNYQYFLDLTQLILLKMFKISASAYIITGFYYIVFLIIDLIKNRIIKIVNLGLVLAAEAVIIFLYILTNTIIVVTQTVN